MAAAGFLLLMRISRTTKALVAAFQAWGGFTLDRTVGNQPSAVPLHAASAMLEIAVGLKLLLSDSCLSRFWSRKTADLRAHDPRLDRSEVGRVA
jgi:hypothetical protein